MSEVEGDRLVYRTLKLHKKIPRYILRSETQFTNIVAKARIS